MNTNLGQSSVSQMELKSDTTSPSTSSNSSLLSSSKREQQASFDNFATKSSHNQNNESMIEENSQFERRPVLTVCSSTSKFEPPSNRRKDILLAEEAAEKQGAETLKHEKYATENSTLGLDLHSNQGSALIQNQHHSQHHSLAQKHKSLETGTLNGQQASRQQHRHSYCAPGEQVMAKNETGNSGSPSKSGQLNAKQTSELSTQAKIINILFTRNEQKVEQSADTEDKAMSNQQKSGKQMLMPSLLRQYQRRLSNFHHISQSSSSNISSRTEQDLNRITLGEEPKEAGNFDSGLDDGQILSGSRAAASLATAAASAAQALVSQQARMIALARKRARCDPANTRGEHQEIKHLSKSQRGLSLLVGSQVNLYTLTEEYKSKLNEHYQRHVLWDNNERIHLERGKEHRIQHFCVNFMNNMHLYEINIVDMPPIEPVSFPTSSLLEWSLFKGQSHLLTADAYLLVFDLTRPSTIQYIKSLRDKIFESREMSNIPAYVIANKADLCPTLQLSLQARRMRNVAARRNQAGLNNPMGQSTLNTTPTSATGAATTLAPKTTSPRSQATFSHPSSTNRFSSSWSRLKRDTRPTIDFGCQYTRTVPTKAAYQLITAYKEHRMRIGSSGPMVSLRRWAKLRRAIVKTNEPNNSCNSAQWLQFERTRAQCKLAFGASGQDSNSNQWVSNVSKALVRLKSRVNHRFRHLGSTNSDNRHRRRMRADTGSRKQRNELEFGQKSACCRYKRNQRKRRNTLCNKPIAARRSDNSVTPESLKDSKVPSGRLVAFSRWFNQSAELKNKREQQQHSSKQAKTRVSFTSYAGDQTNKFDQTDARKSFTQRSSSNLIGGLKLLRVSSRRRLRAKRRRRQDQSESSGSKSSSLGSRRGSKKRQRPDSGLRQYSKLLTTAAKQSSSTENELAALIHQGSANLECTSTGLTAGSLSNATSVIATSSSSKRGQITGELIKSSGRTEPICGSLATTSSRQAFYDLFNKLLQTSSTTVAKTQITLRSIYDNEDEEPQENEKSQINLQRQTDEKKTVVVAPQVALLQISPIDESKEEKRRKSSSTGAALWQTLSSLALNRGSRSSLFGSSEQTKRQTIQVAQSSVLAETAKAELEQQQSRRNTQNVPNGGVHLGTDQYLNIDMLRKLSLISSSSQASRNGSITADGSNQETGEDLHLDGKSGEELNPNRPNSAPVLEVSSRNKLQRGSSDSNSGDLELNARSNTTNPDTKRSSRAKQIWYRGVMKKILFQSNKRSLKSIVTAVRLQRHIDEMHEAEENEAKASRTDKSRDFALGSSVKNQSSDEGGCKVASMTARPTTENFDKRSSDGQSRGKLNNQAAPSIRIFTSGSSLSLICGENGEKHSAVSKEGINGAGSKLNLGEIELDQLESSAEESLGSDPKQTKASKGKFEIRIFVCE